MDGVTEIVAEQLDFDMARLSQVTLDINRIVAEIGPRLALRQMQRFGQLVSVVRDFHALAAAARRGLDQDRISDVLGHRQGFVHARDSAVGPANDRQVQAGDGLLGSHLVAHDADMFGRGADERDLVLGDNLREARVFRQEADAGMDRIGAGNFGGRQDRRNVQIGFA